MEAVKPAVSSVLLALSVIWPLGAPRAQDLGLAKLLSKGAIRAEDSSGRVLAAFKDTELLIPASVMKVATSFCALEALGRDYRFETEFLVASGNVLHVRGSGDPGLVSEELSVIAKKLAEKLTRADRIVIDTSYFADDIEIDGASLSLNPYDSRNAAFVGNFSTAALTRKASGEIVSAEPQTPLTPLSRAAGAKLGRKVTERINLGHNWRVGVQYGGELLAAFLARAGVTGDMRVSLGPVPGQARLALRHESTLPLEELVRGLLKFSTNFTANQLFLHVGASRYGAPATLEKAQRALDECLRKRARWSSFHVEEGSGLSRKNLVSAEHMTKLLKVFEPYSDLLNEQEGFTAKTGTLTGVNTLAGYLTSSRYGRVRFAILVNRAVPFTYKFQVARALQDALD